MLSHHDDCLPGFSIDTDVEPIADAIRQIHPGVDLVTLGYVDDTTVL